MDEIEEIMDDEIDIKDASYDTLRALAVEIKEYVWRNVLLSVSRWTCSYSKQTGWVLLNMHQQEGKHPTLYSEERKKSKSFDNLTKFWADADTGNDLMFLLRREIQTCYVPARTKDGGRVSPEARSLMHEWQDGDNIGLIFTGEYYDD